MSLRLVDSRFWFPSQSSRSHLDGFLPDPESPSLLVTPPAVTTSKEAMSHRYVALLGPPGSGKSTFVRQGAEILPKATNAEILRIGLGSIGTEDRFVSALTTSPQYVRWIAGQDELCLILDGFDEAQQKVPHLAMVFMDLLNLWPLQRLWLRITCRTAEWPAHLNEWLKDMPDSEVFEVAPLRHVDAVQAVGDLPDPGGFIDELMERGLSPLASMPLSLELLMLAFESQGRVPKDRVEAYASGLLALCEEQSAQRRLSDANPILPGEVLVAAEATAAAMVFTGRDGVWVGPVSGASRGDLTFQDISPILPSTSADKLAVLTKLSRSALFQGAGAQRLGWAHATFQEFLAARWCTSHLTSRRQIQPLLCASDGKLFPRTRRVAAWLVSMQPEEFRWLCEIDAQSIAGEIDVADESLRAAVLDALLTEVADGTYIRNWGMRYENLRHSSVSDQLKQWLGSDSVDVRCMAVELAGETAALGLADVLVSLALDPAEPHSLRYRSVLALNDMGWTGAELLVLLDTPALLENDEKLELRGAAIDASHPHALSASQALKYLTLEPAPMFFGHYAVAVHLVADALSSASDLSSITEWLSLPVSEAEGLSELRDAALGVCCDQLDDREARSAALASIRKRLHHYQPIIGIRGLTLPEWTDRRRRATLLMLASECSEDELIAVISCAQQDRLTRRTDFQWMLDQLVLADPPTKNGLVILITHLFMPDDYGHANALASLPDNHVLVTGALSHWCGSVELDSDEGRKQRASWQRYHPSSETPEVRTGGQDEVNDWINRNLNLFDEGDLAAYGHALQLITALPGTKTVGLQFQPDLTKHARWAILDIRARRRLIAGAIAFLSRAKCEQDIWQPSGRTSRVAVAGHRALILLLHTSERKLDELAPEVWQEWAPVIVLNQPAVNGVSDADHETLLRKALPHARAALIKALVFTISEADRSGRTPHVARDCGILWGPDLEAHLIALLTSVSTNTTGELAETLLMCHSDKGRAALESWLAPASREFTDEHRKSALTALLCHSAESSWAMIQATLDKQPAVAVASVLELADRTRQHLDLSDEHLGYFLSWMETHFPRGDDPEFDDENGFTPRAQTGRWRDRMAELLVDHGTREAVEALQRLAESRPDETWRRSMVARAMRSHRDLVWEPVELDTFRMMAGDEGARIVRTLGDLRDTVLECLERVQERLVGETPESHLLWDTRVMRPKSEDEISDYLLQKFRDQLAGRMLIVNREVQVRRNSRSGIPERSDLLIEAPSAESVPLRLVVETKGAWSRELETAIPEQLVGRYLHDYPGAQGLYIVLWPDLASWSPDSGGADRARMARLERQATRDVLSRQAGESWGTGHNVDVVHLDMSYLRLTREARNSGTS
jgi:energy-coupling factor transporter ATP-binding protein EcfA2